MTLPKIRAEVGAGLKPAPTVRYHGLRLPMVYANVMRQYTYYILYIAL